MVFTPGAIWGALQDLPPSAVARNGVPPIRDWNPFRTGKSAEFVYPETYTFPAASVATAIATSVLFPPKVFEYERAGRTIGSAARADTAASARTMAAHLAVPQIPAFHPPSFFLVLRVQLRKHPPFQL